MLKRTFIVLAPIVLTACGTFQLANDIRAPMGSTTQQEQTDILFCKDQARMAASTAEKQTQAFLLGLTIVGAPVAYEDDKKTQRETFAKCMRAKGYKLRVASDNPTKETPASGSHAQEIQQSPQVAKNTAPHLTHRASNVANNKQGENGVTARLEELKSLKDKGLISQSDYDKKKNEILNSM